MARYIRAMTINNIFPAVFTAADVQAVSLSISNNTAEVKFGGASVIFRSVADLPRVRVIVDDLAAMDVALSSGVDEVEFRDRRTKFRSTDGLKERYLKLLNSLRSLVASDVTVPVKPRNPLKVRYVKYARGY